MIADQNQPGVQAPRREVSAVQLGVIDYLNVLPVYDWILANDHDPAALGNVQISRGVPATMNAALGNGAVDVSNVSSFAYGREVSSWLLVPHLSVAAHGRVDSVLLFSRFDTWSALEGKSIAITNQSATSAALVRLLCEQRYGIHPELASAPSDLAAMLATHDAALMIGDGALVERYAQRSFPGIGVPYCFDLATEWMSWTGLPFVFAVWAARADRIAALRSSGVIDLLRFSKQRGLARLDGIAAESAARLGLSHAQCADYLRLLDYDLSAQDLAGLRTFLELAIPGFKWSAVRVFED